MKSLKVMIVVAVMLMITGCSDADEAASDHPRQATSTAKPEQTSASSPPAQAASRNDASSTPSEPGGGGAALEIDRTGYGVSRSDGSFDMPDYVWAVAMATNDSENISAINVSFSVYDKGGKVIGQGQQSSNILRSHQTSAIGTQIEIPSGSKISKVVSTANVLQGLSIHDDNPDSEFVTKNVHFQPDRFNPSVLGEVESRYQQSVESVHVEVVCFDSGDEIIGGGESYIEAIGSGQRVGFESHILITTGEPKTCDAYANLSVMSNAS